MKLANTNFLTLLLLLGSFAFAQSPDGELKRWHKVTLTFNGPNTSETANPNPFSDYNLEVTFKHNSSNRTFKVPGFFAACGDAEESSCQSGNKWRVNFTPDNTGAWSWTASFKQGNDVAINGGGSSAGFMDGATGSFNVAESDKSGRDFRSKDLGRLKYVGEHYLKHVGTNPTNPNGPWFVKAGADSPENALNYVDFDATPSYNNNLNKIGSKTWQPHQRDYVASDASSYTWDNGKGTEILGMLNYLSDQGANVMSFLTWNSSGDGGAVFPHTLKVSLQEYGNTARNEQWNKVNKDRFDVSKMAQWEKVMEYADKKGIYLHFKTMETENDNLMDGNSFGRQRKLYYRELIARFGHHLALNWNLTEETTIPDGVVKSTATYIKNLDPYNHHIVIHTYPNQQDQRYNPLLGNNSNLTGASIQTGKDNVHNDVRRWLEKSRNSGKKWVVANDEQGPASTGVRISDKEVRYKILWATLMAGGTGVEYYSGYTNDDGDINGNDHRKRGNKYKEGGYALNFFNEYLQADMIDMVSSDGVTSDSNDYVFANAGEVYAIYRPNGGSTGLNLPSGNSNYEVQWYNPRSGGNLSSKQTLGGNLVAPDNNDWVALIRSKDGSGGGNGGDECVALEQDGIVAVEAEHFVAQAKDGDRKWYIQNGSTNTPTPDPDPDHSGSSSEGGYIEILPDTRVTHDDPLVNGVSFTNTPGQVAVLDYKVKFTNPGKYYVWVRAYSTGSEDNGIHVGLDGNWPSSGARMQWCAGKNQWTWESKQRTNENHCGEAQKIYLDIPSAGVHTISFSMREDGFEFDKFVLSKAYTKPTGSGPDEVLTDCGGGGNGGECQELTYNAISDFGNINVSGFSPAYRDNTRGALAIDASQYKDEFAAAETTFNGETAAYDIKLNTLRETDGESTYRLVVDGRTVGTFKNPTTTVDYAPSSKVFENVSISKGNTIRVEFNSHTNGNIPEGNSTAYSRGRWTSLEFTCSSGDNGGENKPPSVSITNPDQSNYDAGSDIAVEVSASDEDGSVVKYEVYVNGNLVDTDGSAYTPHIIENVQIGNYTVEVKVTDNEGASTTASSSFTVGQQSASIAIPGAFEAEAFDSKNGSVRIENTPGTSGKNLGFINDGDYTNYKVNVASGGDYQFDIYASSAGVGGTIEILEGGQLKGSIDVPVNNNWHAYKKYSTTISLTAGTKTLRLNYEGNPGYLFNVDRVVVSKSQAVLQTIALSPIHDAYLQGSTRYNQDMVRIENGKRTGYLMFDLSKVNGTITKAELKFTVYSDEGFGNLNIHRGATNNWTETNLSNANKPAASELLANTSGDFKLGTTKTISLDAAAIKGSKFSIVMSKTSGNDFAFASKENGTVAKPQLVITYSGTKEFDDLDPITVYPNPVVDYLSFSGNYVGKTIKVFNMLGSELLSTRLEEGQNTVDLSNLSTGYYMVNIIDLDAANKGIITKKILKN